MSSRGQVQERVLSAVKELTDKGSVGFYASAVAAMVGISAAETTAALLHFVDKAKLELRFELRCPDNGRRVASFGRSDEIPLGEEFNSDRCESPESFVVDEADVFVRFVPSRKFAAAVRRKTSEEEKPEGGTQGKVRGLWRRLGQSPALSLP
jgi:hypothetical protein